MNKTILLFLAVLFFESLTAQTLKKQIIKKVFDKICCIEEYDSTGTLFFSKEFNDLNTVNQDIGKDIEIRANLLNPDGNVEYKIWAHNKSGYQINKLVYKKDKNEVFTYLINATEDNEGNMIESLTFFTDLSGFSEFVNHPHTKEMLQKNSYLHNRKYYKNGRLVREVYVNPYGDSTQYVYYSYHQNLEKRWYSINNQSDELIKVYDSAGRISSEIQILQHDTLYVTTHKYSKNNQLVESIHHINPMGYGDRSYKELYVYNAESFLVKKSQVDMKNQPQYIHEYSYKNGLISEETITEFKTFGKEAYTIAYFYKFY